MPLNPPIDDWHGRVAWIVGASSGIGQATAAALHAQGATVLVSARNAVALQSFVDAHAGSAAYPLDVDDVAALHAAARGIHQRHGRIDFALYCAAHYQAMRATEYRLDEMLRHQRVNVVGALNWLDALLPLLVAQRAGHLSLVASAAGYRALPQSLAYGPTKAALQHLAEGLYLDLHEHGIGVSVVNPGFVATPLTAGNRFHMPALMTPEAAAGEMLRGWARGRYEIHFPKRFTGWLKLLQHASPGVYFAAVKRATGL